MPPPPPDRMPGVGPVSYDGGRVGALLCHGYTGTPQSLGAWPERLAAAGLTVRLPLLPGHGTHWRAMAATRWPDWYGAVDDAFAELRRRCDEVFVMGLSMGGTLALRLAEQHPDDVAGLVLVNPSLWTDNRLAPLTPLLKWIVPSTRGPAGEIARPGVTEPAYDRHPVRAFDSLRDLWRVTRADLPRVTAPLVVYRSATDAVVPAACTEWVLRHVRSTDKQAVVLPRSRHVATLDHDAEAVFAGSVAFVSRLSRFPLDPEAVDAQ